MEAFGEPSKGSEAGSYEIEVIRVVKIDESV